MDARWWNEETAAVVTGANKGIGLEVCKQLAEQGLKVVLTARNENRGRAAVTSLQEQGLHNVIFHQLDVQDEQSIATFASWLCKELGGLDILINNAAVNGVVLDEEYLKGNNIDPRDIDLRKLTPKAFIIEYESAKACLDANYYGVKRISKALIPLFRPGARIINVGSDYGKLCRLPSLELQQKLHDLNKLSERDIDDVIDKYLDDVKSKSVECNGWPLMFPSYKVSKVALHAYTRMLAEDLEKRPPSRRILVNVVHPGFVSTALTYFQGAIHPPEGAQNVVRVALFPHQDCPSGKFFYEKTLSDF